MSESKKAYKWIWKSEHADTVDLGAHGTFDELYELFLDGEQFKQTRLKELCVLDLGAGKGSRLAQHLSERGAQMIAVDWIYEDPEFPLRYDAQRVAADVLDTGLSSDSVDLLISANVLINNSYLAPEEQKRAYLHEILRLLKPDGIAWMEEKDLPADLMRGVEGIKDYNFFNDTYIHVFKKG